MKLSTCCSILILIGICFMTGPAPVSAEDGDLGSLLDKISQRIYSYPEKKIFKEVQIVKVIAMNGKWEPKKTTIIKQIVKHTDDMIEFEILEVKEMENGKSTDITTKYVGTMKKRNMRMILSGQRTENPLISFLDMYFPFDESKRSDFNIRRLDNAVMYGKDAFVLEYTAGIKDEMRYEGTCYIDQNTFDILKLDVKPSKNPKSVEEMRTEMEFEVLPEGYFVMKKKKEKIEEKAFFKTNRQIVETEYMDAP